MSEYNQTNERRKYYRIDDTAIFTYKVLDKKPGNADEIPEIEKNTSAAFEMAELFGQMNQQMKATLGRIAENSADIAGYLKHLDSKIDLLLQTNLFKDNQAKPEPHRQINLSAGGMAFGSNEEFKQSTLLALDMVLSTDLLCLHLTGRVIQVSKQAEGDYPYRVSVGFIDISESQADQIIKHIMSLQSEQLRARREE